MPSKTMKIRRALISVSDKTGVLDLARKLHDAGTEILSTGGTAKLLQAKKIPVTEVADYTGFPEMMGGRVKTLHPKIHGGILGRRGEDDAVMQQHQIPAIDMVVVNLYPFAATIAKPDCSLENAIENIDIGGPAMLRSAAKNHAAVTVVVDPGDYSSLIEELEINNGSLSLERRFALAAKAFAHTATYDTMIASYLHQQINNEENQASKFPQSLQLTFNKAEELRYGENPHQQAAFYRDQNNQEASVSSAKQLQGKALSFNNIADTDAALECIKQFDAPSCVIVKHANPCGVATADDLLQAYDLAYKTDPTSAFGGIIAFNQVLDEKTATAIIERQFVEVIIAPTVSAQAQAIVAKKPNLRLLVCGEFNQVQTAMDLKRVTGGLLVQDRDLGVINKNDLRLVSKRTASPTELNDLLFAWRIAKFVKSNAIVYALDQRTIGIGAGQMSRVYSAKVAAIKAADESLQVAGSVMASDAFFPFRDGIDAAHEAGIVAVIQPGGSQRDAEVIQAADEHGMAMVFTGMRHFRH